MLGATVCICILNGVYCALPYALLFFSDEAIYKFRVISNSIILGVIISSEIKRFKSISVGQF